MMPFHKAPLSFILGWPILLLVMCGIGAIVVAIGSGLLWLLDHLAWIP